MQVFRIPDPGSHSKSVLPCSSRGDTDPHMRIGYFSGLAAATTAGTLAVWVSVHAQSSAAAQPAVDFARDIQPILQKNCYECHGPKKTKARLRLDSQAGIMPRSSS